MCFMRIITLLQVNIRSNFQQQKLAAGMYTLMVETDFGFRTKRLVVGGVGIS